MTGRHERELDAASPLFLMLDTGSYVMVRPGTTRPEEQSFRNTVDALSGDRDFRLFRHLGTEGADLGPIAVDMAKVAFISPMKEAME